MGLESQSGLRCSRVALAFIFSKAAFEFYSSTSHPCLEVCCEARGLGWGDTYLSLVTFPPGLPPRPAFSLSIVSVRGQPSVAVEEAGGGLVLHSASPLPRMTGE